MSSFYDKKTCGTETRMGLALCETYARDPKFYGAEFAWAEDGQVVGS